MSRAKTSNRRRRPSEIGKTNSPPVRLACLECDRDDHDGIRRGDFARLRKEGWRDITEFQTYAKSLETYPLHLAPPDYDATAWYTHLGLCPDCSEDS